MYNDAQDFYYFSYEIPYRGVSFENPTGHLLMALRNRKRERPQGVKFLKILENTIYSGAPDQVLLYGILAIAPWQLVFFPCINVRTTPPSMAHATRLFVMQSLRRTEPWFQHVGACGLPATIPLAKIDHILAVDRQNRMHKFDPITSTWSFTPDGVKSYGVNPMVRAGSHQLSHTPRRLIFCTTDFDVYAFRPCSNGIDASGRNLKSHKYLRHFLSELTTQIGRIRAFPGVELTLIYSSGHRFSNDTVSSPHSCDVTGSSWVNSIDPFVAHHSSSSERRTADCGSEMPINKHPVHPTVRLNQTWFSHDLAVSSADVVTRWIDNTDFAYCRTYPLRVPFLPFKQPLMNTRNGFTGHRFPILSYCHPSGLVSQSGVSHSQVWLLRAGACSLDLDPRLIIDVDHPFSCRSNRDTHSKRHIVMVRLKATSLDVAENACCSMLSDSETMHPQHCARRLIQRSSFHDVSDNNLQARTQLFVRRCSEILDVCTENDFDQHPSSHLLMGTASPIGKIDSNLTWCVPRAEVILKAWLRFSLLVRLSLMNTPPCSAASAFKMDFSGIAISRSQSTSSFDEPLSDILSEVRSLNHVSTGPQYFGLLRNLADNIRTPPHRLRASSIVSPLPGHRALTSSDTSARLSVERGSHRSGWYEHLYTTRWLNLVTLCLRQATQLAQLICRLATDYADPKIDFYVLICGPDSGRTWQPLLVSLAQIILSPVARTLAGFEDIIEREWVRLGYPFAPDPPDWLDESVPNDYDNGAMFGLFIDCVHQLMYQFPTDFEFTEDYLVLLLDCALSRGGGLPPFSIEFACSCEAARSVSTKAKTSEEIEMLSDNLFRRGAFRCFRDWTAVLTTVGLGLLGNWYYYWQNRASLTCEQDCNGARFPASIPESTFLSEALYPCTSPPSFIRCWIHGWFRWCRSLRLTNGGGYAFDMAFCRDLLGMPNDLVTSEEREEAAICRPKTSATPYTGWLSDEAIHAAESLGDTDLRGLLNSNLMRKFYDEVEKWEVILGGVVTEEKFESRLRAISRMF